MQPQSNSPTILLLGAGYANITLLKSLPKSAHTSARFMLITDSSAYCESVLLHEVASGYRGDEILHPLAEILSTMPSLEIIQDRVQAIHAHDKRILCANGSYAYDVLIVGLGFRSDSFGIAGVEQYALPLTNFTQARAIYARICENLDHFVRTRDSAYLRVVVCGGGFSGCELVATLAQELPKLARQRGIQEPIELVCVEALPNVLPMFDKTLAQKGRAYLEKLGVIVRSSCRILACEQGGIILEDSSASKQPTPKSPPKHPSADSGVDSSSEKIASFCVIWTAGVQGSEVIAHSFGAPKSRAQITPYLHPKSLDPALESNPESTPESCDTHQSAPIDTESIFILGDCSALLDPETNRFYPPTAQMASAQGRYVAGVLASRLAGSTNTPAPFTYAPQGTICSLGSRYGVGVLGARFRIAGIAAIAIKRMSEWRWRFMLKH